MIIERHMLEMRSLADGAERQATQHEEAGRFALAVACWDTAYDCLHEVLAVAPIGQPPEDAEAIAARALHAYKRATECYRLTIA